MKAAAKTSKLSQEEIAARVQEVAAIHFGLKEVDPAVAYLLAAMIQDADAFSSEAAETVGA